MGTEQQLLAGAAPGSRDMGKGWGKLPTRTGEGAFRHLSVGPSLETSSGHSLLGNELTLPSEHLVSGTPDSLLCLSCWACQLPPERQSSPVGS